VHSPEALYRRCMMELCWAILAIHHLSGMQMRCGIEQAGSRSKDGVISTLAKGNFDRLIWTTIP